LIGKRTSLDLIFSSRKYKKVTVGSADGDISSDALSETGYGAGLSLQF